MPKPVYRHYGKVLNGKKVYYNPDLQAITVNELEGKEFEEITKVRTKKVSTDQHGYYRAGIVRECARYEIFGGWTEDEIDDHLCKMFLTFKRIKILKNDDGSIEQVDATKTLSTGDINLEEMREFIEKCIIYCAQKGIVVQDSNEYYEGRYKTIYEDKK